MSNGFKLTPAQLEFERTLRNPWWRFRHYVKLYGIAVAFTAGFGWLLDGWNGIYTCILVTSCIFIIGATLWEMHERDEDDEWEAVKKAVAESIETGHNALVDEERQEPPAG